MNALSIATQKVGTEIERIVRKLNDVDDAYTTAKGYTNDLYTRQGARALSGQLQQVLWSVEDGRIGDAAGQLDYLAERWNAREDWRTGAFKANVAKAVERLVGLS
jgi:hypothetical protein